MPKFDFTAAQVSDIAAFLHSFRVGGYDASRNRPPTIVVGDAKAGEAYFNSKCASCHSATGDLKGIGSENHGRPNAAATLADAGGRRTRRRADGSDHGHRDAALGRRKVEGRLGRIDDFTVQLTEADGTVADLPPRWRCRPRWRSTIRCSRTRNC